ncbi:unnamed protein product [Adineta ricciae]|uniref:Phosphate transporter n=1 Tax=Adineta ricciae TaxID=249248 RepID=A0A814LNU7_ADIRI|nr:unnamed protein product [Adineta ricciae]
MIAVEPYSIDLLWILIIGFIVAFILAFGIGANDVANSFGTSVGSKVLTLRQACILATIFEILGSILIGMKNEIRCMIAGIRYLGAKVSDTIRKGIIDLSTFDNPKELMLGQLSSLIGCCIWLLVATFFNLPVSGTHSIVGATVGFALVARGSSSIQWAVFGKIGASWFISPALAGIISISAFLVIRKFILQQEDHLRIGLAWLPFFYGATIMINAFSIIHSAPPMLHFHKIQLWENAIITVTIGVLVGLFIMIVVKPRLKRSIEETLKKKRELGSRDEKPQLTKTEGRFETYTVTRLENVNTSDKETQIDHISMLKEYDLIRYQQQHPDQFRPYVEMPRIRKDSETLSNSGFSTVSRGRRENERIRYDPVATDNVSVATHRANPASSIIREKTKIYRLPQYSNTNTAPAASVLSENKSLLLASDDDNISTISGNQASSNEDLDEVEDKMPEISTKKKKIDTTNDSLEIATIFKYLQILTAIFGAFAHGGNDVSNAIGPLIGLWLVYVDGVIAAKSTTPLWVLFFGGLGISVGLWVWGRRVIRTIGEDLTKITPSSGFIIEISTAFTVLFASNFSIPISTTHCKVGSVVAIGRVRSKQSVDWSLFRNIIVAWIVTVPVTGGIAAGVMALLRHFAL